jgi:hypothetical protein
MNKNAIAPNSVHQNQEGATAISHQAFEDTFELSEVEVETLRRAAQHRRLTFDPDRRTYSKSELIAYGLVREGYTRHELTALGFLPGEVSCHDSSAKAAEDLLAVDAPFGSGIKKWQLPINTLQMRIEQTIFPPNTHVKPHVHPENSSNDTGGGLRIVIKGKIIYKGREFGPGDWFFVPNGVPYAFITDPAGPTTVMYKYAFFGDALENRFSHPHAA